MDWPITAIAMTITSTFIELEWCGLARLPSPPPFVLQIPGRVGFELVPPAPAIHGHSAVRRLENASQCLKPPVGQLQDGSWDSRETGRSAAQQLGNSAADRSDAVRSTGEKTDKGEGGNGWPRGYEDAGMRGCGNSF